MNEDQDLEIPTVLHTILVDISRIDSRPMFITCTHVREWEKERYIN